MGLGHDEASLAQEGPDLFVRGDPDVVAEGRSLASPLGEDAAAIRTPMDPLLIACLREIQPMAFHPGNRRLKEGPTREIQQKYATRTQHSGEFR